MAANWEEYANDDEKQRLAELRARQERMKVRQLLISDEIQRLMQRSIRRMRRANGKE